MITSKNYTQLHIQTSLNRFSFLVKNLLSHEITDFYSIEINPIESIENQLENIFNSYEILQKKYDSVVVLHDNKLNTFVPQALFDENSMGAYLQYTTKIFSTDFFAFDELSLFEMNNVYVPYMNVNNFLIDKFGTFIYQNINTPLVTKILDYSRNQLESTVYAHIQKDHFEIIVVKNAKLILFNSFYYQTPEDFIYYLLFTYEQLDLSPEINKLILLGMIEEQDELYLKINSYIKFIEIHTPKAFISDSLKINDKINQHYILFNL